MKKGFFNNISKLSTGEIIANIVMIISALAILAVIILNITKVIETDTDILVPLIAIENLGCGYATRNREGNIYKFNYGIGIFLIILWPINLILDGFGF